MNYNKAIVAGHLTRDPELKKTTSGTSVANFSIATNHYYSKDGEKKEDVNYHNIVVFGSTAENCEKFLFKGSTALVEGRIATRTYEKDGEKKYVTEIIADNVQFGEKPTSNQSSYVKAEPKDGDIDVEDIPF